jgi:uncharacterized protein with HEPN domain
MRDYAAEAVLIAMTRSRDELDADRLLALGLTKLVEIIGEAASRVSTTIRDPYQSPVNDDD